MIAYPMMANSGDIKNVQEISENNHLDELGKVLFYQISEIKYLEGRQCHLK